MPTASSTARPRTARISSRCSIRRPTPRRQINTRCAIPRRHPQERCRWRPRRIWGAGADLGQPDQHPQPDDGREGTRLGGRARAPAGQSGLLQGRAPTIRPRRCFRCRTPAVICRCTTRRPSKFTLISTCFPTHHLIFAEDANNTLWVSSGVTGPGAVGWLNRKMFEETGDEVKSQGWSPFILDTNGNGKRDDYVEPNVPTDPTKDKRDRDATCTASASTRATARSGAPTLGYSRPCRARRAGGGSDAHRADRGLRAAVARLRAARRRHRPQRHLLGVARERPSRQVRPQQVQGAQRSDRDRQALPRGLDALPLPRAAVQGRAGRRQRRGELLHLGRPVQHARARRATCRSRPAT